MGGTLAVADPQPRTEVIVHDGLCTRVHAATITARVSALLVDLGFLYTLVYPAVLAVLLVFVLIVALLGSFAEIVRALGIEIGRRDFGIAVLTIFLVLLVFLVTVQHLYFVIYERRRGGTPGKRTFGLYVMSSDGRRVSLGQAVVRDLTRWFEAMLVLPPLLVMWRTSRRLRIGDALAQTLVVRLEDRARACERLFLPERLYAPLARLTELRPGFLSGLPTEIRGRFERERTLAGSIGAGDVYETNPASAGLRAPDDSLPADAKWPVLIAVPGGFWRRFTAYMIDASIAAVASWPLGLVAGFPTGGDGVTLESLVEGQAASLVAGGAVWIAYCAFFYPRMGATPGKIWLGLTVRRDATLRKLTIGQSVWRETGARFLGVFATLGLGCLWMLVGSERRTLHDRLSSSKVLHVRKEWL